jgi:hypothetical protein
MRRLFLLYPLLLLACTNTTPYQVATDIATLANGVAGAAKVLAQDNVLPSSTLVTVDQDVSIIQAAALAVAQATAQSAQQTAVQQAADALNAVVNTLATAKGIPQEVQTALQAAEVLLPVIETEVGLQAPAGAATAMIPDQARGILEAEAQKLH